MSSVNLFVSLQLPSKNAADPKRKPLLSSILQEYALRRVFYQKTSLFLQLARGDGERETPKDLFPRSLPTKGSECPEDKGGCVFDFNNAQCPYGDKCSRSHAKNPTKSPNRRLRQLQRTARTHRKCERSSHTCAGCLRRRSDCSWRRRSPAYSAAAVKKMMIRTRHRRIVLTQLYKSPCKLCKDAFWGYRCAAFPPI